ncbi:hypothetical protein L596_013613 [Steinernema carpocapsae]|uniref:Uncharacterized protein n=1 Tax=Steinernema carpocapsae TaxID=34508 RepID=A0A4U5P1C4_STECR|nr:hypothetical protein L596_013613 [Steinernema carpocapsae]
MPPDLSATIFKCETAKSIASDFSKMKEFEKEQGRRTELKKELEDVQVQSLKREYMEYCEAQKLEKSTGKAATECSSGCRYITKIEWFDRVLKEQAKFPELRQHGCETTVEYDLWISQRIHQLIHGISEREIQIIDVPGMGMLRYDGSKNNVSKVPFLSHDNILEDQERSPDGFGSSKIRKVNESAPLPYTAKPRVIHTRANCPLPSDNFPVEIFSYPDHLHTACQPINILPVTTHQKSQVPAKPRRAIRITHLNSLSELDRRRAELLLPSERLRRSSTVAQRPESLGGHQHHMLERDRLLELTEDDWCQCNHCQEVIHPGQNLDDVLGK